MNDELRVNKWIDCILKEISALKDEKGVQILKNCGENCAKGTEMLKGAQQIRDEYKNELSPEILFNKFKDKYYNTPNMIKKGNEITLIFNKCTCPIVKKGVNHSFLCNCTTGYTHKIFETLFDKKVNVKLKQSVLNGDKVCKQVITI